MIGNTASYAGGTHMGFSKQTKHGIKCSSMAPQNINLVSTFKFYLTLVTLTTKCTTLNTLDHDLPVNSG